MAENATILFNLLGAVGLVGLLGGCRVGSGGWDDHGTRPDHGGGSHGGGGDG